jgi:hypothetical protein
VGLQVDLGRAAGALEHDHVGLGAERIIGALDALKRRGLVAHVGRDIHVLHRPAEHDDLGTGVRRGFE